MMDKIEMQTAGIERGQEALDRERRLEELRASLDGASSPMSAAHILDLQQRNDTLTSEVAVAIDKMKKMRAFIKNQDALFRAEEQKRVSKCHAIGKTIKADPSSRPTRPKRRRRPRRRFLRSSRTLRRQR
jgi:hypothetical protein